MMKSKKKIENKKKKENIGRKNMQLKKDSK